MEKQLYHNINLIIDSIEKQASEEQRVLEETAEKLYREKLRSLEDEISSKYEAKTQYELQKLAVDANKKANELETENKSKLSAVRENIVKEVFGEAAEKVKKFVSSEKYADFLAKSAQEISGLYGGDVKVFLKPDDRKYESIVSAPFSGSVEFESDESIKIGGIKVMFVSHSVIADDTLDGRLELKRKDFIKNSGLGFRS